jgi:hypothetical protein
MEDNLSNRIYKAKRLYDNQALDNRFDKIPHGLSTSEKTALLMLLSKGLSARSKRKIFLLLNVPLRHWYDYGIYNRVEFKNGVNYCTGQDWTMERKTLLKCIEGYYD